MHIHQNFDFLSTNTDLSSPELVFPQSPQLCKVETLSFRLLRPRKVNKTTSRNRKSSLILFFPLCLLCISQPCQRFLQGLPLHRSSPGLSQLPFLHVDSPLFRIESCFRACASDHPMSVSSPAPAVQELDFWKPTHSHTSGKPQDVYYDGERSQPASTDGLRLPIWGLEATQPTHAGVTGPDFPGDQPQTPEDGLP